MIEEDRFIGWNWLDRLDIPLQPGSFLLANVDDFDGDPMILNLPDFGQADIDAGTAVVQPQTNLDKITGNQLVGSRHLRAGFIDSQDAAVRLELPMHPGEHTVDGQVGNRPAGLMLSYLHGVDLD